MPRDERSPRFAHGEQRKGGSPTFDEEMDTDVYAEVSVNPARSPRKSKAATATAGHRVTDDAFVDDSPEGLSTAPSAPPPRLLTSMFPRSSWCAQAFQYSLTEGGMALMTAFILFLISLAGVVTLYCITPSRTTSVYNLVKREVEAMVEDAPQGMLDSFMPEVLRLLQAGLQVMVIPGVMLGAAGLFVLGSAERRRPGCWLTSYACAAIILGLALLYLLLRVLLSGSLHGLQARMNESLFEVWGKAAVEVAPCQWQDVFACSGFHYCCVTNTTELEDSAAWDSICFATLPSGAAVLKDGTDITTLATAQCGQLRLTEVMNVSSAALYTTACTAASAIEGALSSSVSTTRRASCENYIVGHLTSTYAFALCLVLGMSVCSLVSGVVAVISSLQRTRTSDFMLVNNPAVVVGENAMTAKGRN